jgi:hypothetical protein
MFSVPQGGKRGIAHRLFPPMPIQIPSSTASSAIAIEPVLNASDTSLHSRGPGRSLGTKHVRGKPQEQVNAAAIHVSGWIEYSEGALHMESY